MAQVVSTAGFYFPGVDDGHNNAVPGFSGVTIDSATEYVANIVPIVISGTITKIGFRSATVTAEGTGEIRIETVLGRGPSGTLVTANALASYPVTVGNTWHTVALNAGAVVYAGSLIAVKIMQSETTGATGNFQVSQMNYPVADFPAGGLPFSARFQGTTTNRETDMYVMGLEYADGTYPLTYGIAPYQAVSTNTYNSGSTNDEFGALFSLPFPATCKGFYIRANPGTAGSARFILYGADTTTILATADIVQDGRANTSVDMIVIPLATAVTFVAAGTYRLTFVPMTATNVSTYSLVGSSAAVMPQLSNGERFYETRRGNSGGWTNDNRLYPLMGVILTGFDDATGGASTTVVTGGAWGF